MKFFRFAYLESEKSMGRAFLYALLLAFLTALSFLIIFFRFYTYTNSAEFKDEVREDVKCQIINYQLSCEDEYQVYEGLVIDVNNQYKHNSYHNIILTKDKIIFEDREVTYEYVMTLFGHDQSDFTADDFIKSLNEFLKGFSILAFILSFIGAYLFYIIGNFILAGIMMLIINSVFKTQFTYKQMYILTMIVVIPYVLFNAITRSIFYFTLSGFISAFIPIFSFLIMIFIDYAFIYGLTYLAVKEGLKLDEPYEITSEE